MEETTALNVSTDSLVWTATAVSNQVSWERRGRDRMVVGFTITCVTSAYHH